MIYKRPEFETLNCLHELVLLDFIDCIVLYCIVLFIYSAIAANRQC